MEPVANRQLRKEPSGARPDGSSSLVSDTTTIHGDAVAIRQFLLRGRRESAR
jgi:hypothetical protein